MLGSWKRMSLAPRLTAAATMGCRVVPTSAASCAVVALRPACEAEEDLRRLLERTATSYGLGSVRTQPLPAGTWNASNQEAGSGLAKAPVTNGCRKNVFVSK